MTARAKSTRRTPRLGHVRAHPARPEYEANDTAEWLAVQAAGGVGVGPDIGLVALMLVMIRRVAARLRGHG